MVQAPSSVAVGRSAGCRAATASLAKTSTIGKCDEFSQTLWARVLEAPRCQQFAGTRGCAHDRFGAAHARREIHPGDPALTGSRRRSCPPADQGPLGAGDLAEWLSLINPPGGVESQAPEAAARPAAPGAFEVAELVERWVRRMAVGGDQRRGVARLEIEQGRFSGAELLVVAEGGRITVEAERARRRCGRRALGAGSRATRATGAMPRTWSCVELELAVEAAQHFQRPGRRADGDQLSFGRQPGAGSVHAGQLAEIFGSPRAACPGGGRATAIRLDATSRAAIRHGCLRQAYQLW